MSVPAEQMAAGLTDAVGAGVARADGTTEPEQTEIDEVKRIFDEYTAAREFDEYARKQFAIDRRYAQGTAEPRWASDANIIGAFIDILVSFLYARDPDVSARPAPVAGGQPDAKTHLFAETMQIVVSRLWKRAMLKKRMKKILRSALSIGAGWFKVLAYSETKPNPLVEKQMGDARDNLARLQAVQESLGADGTGDADREAKITEIQNLMTGLEAKLELIIRQGITIDFLRAEDVQVSLDVCDISDYLEADWNSNDLYVNKKDLKVRFENLTDDDVRTATSYSRRKPTVPNSAAEAMPLPGDVDSESAFVKGTDPGSAQGGNKPLEFAKVVELWDHRDNLIKTFIEGVKRWAVPPYPPRQATTRFFPYFYLAFFETDGSRHSQSLSGRMRKLQDEYSQTRSAGRLTRERSIPGVIFNAGQLDETEVKKLQDSEHMEYVGLKPTNQDTPLDRVVTAKPLPRIDPLLFDTQAVQRDMEVISGVQEAKQSSVTTPKTATEAEIQESGFAARSGADRDAEEDMLTDLAQYTAEIALQTIKPDMAQRIAGPLAFWPFGMDVQDLLMMMDVEIKGGTTGKPRARADKETWATLLPLVQQMQANIMQVELTNPLLAKAMRALMRETVKRLDDTINFDELLPPPPITAAGAAPGLPLGGAPAQGAPEVGAPPTGNGTVNNPAAVAPPS